MAAAAMTPRWSETALRPASFPGVSVSIDACVSWANFFGLEAHFTQGIGDAAAQRRLGKLLRVFGRTCKDRKLQCDVTINRDSGMKNQLVF
jgi:hypothetical protein